jgi:hypothetical protein
MLTSTTFIIVWDSFGGDWGLIGLAFCKVFELTQPFFSPIKSF